MFQNVNSDRQPYWENIQGYKIIIVENKAIEYSVLGAATERSLISRGKENFYDKRRYYA